MPSRIGKFGRLSLNGVHLVSRWGCIVLACPLLAHGIRLSAAPPLACTQAAGPIRATSAVLDGMAVPNGEPTRAWFEWGVRGHYDWATQPIDLGSGSQVVVVTALTEGLVKNEVYQQRLVVSNASAVVRGAPTLFTTGGRALTLDLLPGYPGPDPYPYIWTTRSFNVVAIGLSGSSGLGLLSDGTLVNLFLNMALGPTNVSAFAAGYYHTVQLYPDGTVATTGDNMFGQTNVPLGLKNVVAVAAGYSHSLALISDGTVVAWGDNALGETSLPSGLQNIVAVACGDHFSSALRADGTVVAWGNNDRGQTNVPAGLTNVVAIASGQSHTVALRADGTAAAWGDNTRGQTNVPASLSDFVAVSAGDGCSLALRFDGMVTGWGQTSCHGWSFVGWPREAAAIAGGGCLAMMLCSNRPPVAYDQQWSGPPEIDQIIQLSGWDEDNDQLSFRISSLPERGTLYQYSSGTRGALISAPGTPITDYLHRVVFAPDSAALSTPYASFTFVINDGEADSLPGPITVNVLIPDPPRFDLTGCRPLSIQQTPMFQLLFTGTSNATYQVWASENLLDWNLLGNATSLGEGHFTFLDYPTPCEKRFYRAKSP
jgi:hypothetical protein